MRLFSRRSPGPQVLQTPRLDLVPISPAHIEAEESGSARLSALLTANLPASWPPEHWEPHVRAMIALQGNDRPETLGWHRYIVLREPAPAQLIGCLGGFPKNGGEVEVGYSTLPEFQRRGFGTEAAQALVEWLLQQDGVTAVTAQAYTTHPESIKVMVRCGMLADGHGDEADTVRYRRVR